MIPLNKCPICASDKLIRWGKKYITRRKKPLNLVDSEDQFLLTRLNKKSLTRSISFCCSCAFSFQNPSYSEQELSNIYKSEGKSPRQFYEAAGKSVTQLWESPQAIHNREKRKAYYASIITRFNCTSVLDYGGGTGTNLTHSLLKNTKRFVFDFGRDDNNYENGITPLKELDKNTLFDFIICTHVLEHDSDPVKTCKTFQQLIKPKGHLLLEVPFEFPERILSRRPGTIWHINYFTRKTILEIAKLSKWLCISIHMKYMPYAQNHIPCLVGLFEPHHENAEKQNSIVLIHTIFDCFHSLSIRMLNSIFRSIKNKIQRINRNAM